jgi:Type II secretory pathway, pseudopilin PulG
MKKGFTVIELVFIVVVFGIATIAFFFQKDSVDAGGRDEQRKISINAIYYNLENYYESNGYYPETIDEENLTAMDPQLLTDPTGFNIGDPDGLCDFRYEPVNCENEKCRSYTLRSELEREDDYIKGSRH